MLSTYKQAIAIEIKAVACLKAFRDEVRRQLIQHSTSENFTLEWKSPLEVSGPITHRLLALDLVASTFCKGN